MRLGHALPDLRRLVQRNGSPIAGSCDNARYGQRLTVEDHGFPASVKNASTRDFLRMSTALDAQDTYLWPRNSWCCLINHESRFVGCSEFVRRSLEAVGGAGRSDAIIVILVERTTEGAETRTSVVGSIDAASSVPMTLCRTHCTGARNLII